MQIAFWIAGALLVLLLLAAGIGGYGLYYFAIRRDDRRTNNAWDEPLKRYNDTTDEEYAKIQEGEAFLKGRMAEFVSIESRDGLRLWAR